MRLKSPRGYKSKTEDIAPFINSKIDNLASLRQHLPGSILVALDTEGITQHLDGRTVCSEGISEIGVAVFRTNERGPDFIPHLDQFYDQNSIEAFTIRVRKREYGPAVGTMTDVSEKEAGPRLQKFLSQYKGRRILVGFSILTELKWIAKNVPELVNFFTGWVDIQELVSQQRHGVASNDGTHTDQHGLYNTLKAMGISGWHSKHQLHVAANDAVKTLAVLSGLLCNSSFQDITRGGGVSIYTYLPPLQISKIGNRYHPFTAHISTVDGNRLPLQTPVGLAKHCAKYPGLTGVGFHSENEMVARGRVKYWWVAFRSLESLTSFMTKADGSIFEGTKLCVVANGKRNGKSD
ncbi:Nn.00g039910.m01.CDS01 [Neocucurbitaria sp. VM-36]